MLLHKDLDEGVYSLQMLLLVQFIRKLDSLAQRHFWYLLSVVPSRLIGVVNNQTAQELISSPSAISAPRVCAFASGSRLARAAPCEECSPVVCDSSNG